MAGKKRQQAASLARFAALFGLPTGTPASYEEMVGLLLNEPMVLRMKALSINLAEGLAREEIDLAWADVLGVDEQEGARILSEENFSRYLARKRAQMAQEGSIYG